MGLVGLLSWQRQRLRALQLAGKLANNKYIASLMISQKVKKCIFLSFRPVCSACTGRRKPESSLFKSARVRWRTDHLDSSRTRSGIYRSDDFLRRHQALTLMFYYCGAIRYVLSDNLCSDLLAPICSNHIMFARDLCHSQIEYLRILSILIEKAERSDTTNRQYSIWFPASVSLKTGSPLHFDRLVRIRVRVP